MSSRIELFSPAKLNLFFRVLRAREDGYHEISSLFQAISLGDLLSVELGESDELVCSDPELSRNISTNLVFRALDLFRKKTGSAVKARFHLIKKIPMRAGLGGGSGNLATALWGLNQLTGYGASERELAEWAAEVSSDGPFFFSHGTAYCTGRGEVIQDVDSLAESEVWVAKPREGLETPLVYQQCIPSLLIPRNPASILKGFYANQPEYFNDLEAGAFRLLPVLSKVKSDLLELGFREVVMTGSGSAFFCLGQVDDPTLEGIQFFKVEFLSREKGEWYQR
jgi:4-diphosphocytidyl-2-C-methyl-D-erythritol kinase